MTEKELLNRYNEIHYQNQKTDESDFMTFLYEQTKEDAPEINTSQSFEKLRANLQGIPSEQTSKSNGLWLKIAASISILLVAGFCGWFLTKNSDVAEQVTVASNVEKKLINLPDGSRTVLNKGSKLTYPSEFGKDRIVKLEGEAYFDIKKNKKSFAVEAGEIQVKVLGTAFNVNTNGDIITLYVDRGLVAFTSKNQEIKLTKGQQAFYDKKTKKITLNKQPNPNVMSWRNGLFKFNNTSLVEVFASLEKYYGIQFKSENATVNKCTLTASFNNQPLDSILKTIESVLGFKCEYSANTKNVVVSGKGC